MDVKWPNPKMDVKWPSPKMDVKWPKSVVEQYSLPLLINVCHFDVIWCIEFNFPLVVRAINKNIKHECSSLTKFFIKNIATNFFIKNIAMYY